MRRHLVLPVLLASALGLAACGDAPTAADTVSPSAAPSTDPMPTAATPAASEDPMSHASEPSGTPAAAACSSTGMTVDGGSLDDLPDAARATAEDLLDAALRCDAQMLAKAAQESDTTLSFGDVEPDEFFGLPEDDAQVYEVIVTLLTRVPYAAEADDATPATFVWPRAHTGDWADAEEAWKEVVDAGLLTADEADDMRTAGAGYLGWRLGITGDGTWQFLVAGD